MSIKNIDILPNQIEEMAPCYILDIREHEEIKKLPLLINNHHVPMNEILENPSSFNKDEKLIFICAVGMRSKFVAEVFRTQGYDFAYSVLGGVPAINDHVSSD